MGEGQTQRNSSNQDLADIVGLPETMPCTEVTRRIRRALKSITGRNWSVQLWRPSGCSCPWMRIRGPRSRGVPHPLFESCWLTTGEDFEELSELAKRVNPTGAQCFAFISPEDGLVVCNLFALEWLAAFELEAGVRVET